MHIRWCLAHLISGLDRSNHGDKVSYIIGPDVRDGGKRVRLRLAAELDHSVCGTVDGVGHVAPSNYFPSILDASRSRNLVAFAGGVLDCDLVDQGRQ